MCGICGIINFNNNKVLESELLPMMTRMKYRGPDDEGTFVCSNVGLGFVRLSIIDLSSAGHQPMSISEGRYTIVFNGEIYNYIELREKLKDNGVYFSTSTDTEVLLKSYIQWGEDCLDKFNGMFSFVIYDKEKKSVFGARDRYGIKPFYYYLNNDKFIFASEIPPILDTNSVKPQPNNQVIFDYLVFNRTDQTEATFFEGIRKLQHGHCFNIKDNKFEMHRWYNLKDRVKRAKPFKNADEYRKCLNSSVQLRLRSDVPVGVCLSGGLDSSSITSIVLKDFKKDDINTFSAVYCKGDYGDESEFIDEFSPFLNNMHYTHPNEHSLLADIPFFVKIHAEPIPSLGPYAQYKVMECARKNVVVTLDGQGADEELAGYHYFYGFFFKDLFISFKWILLFKEMYSYFKCHHSIFAYKTFIYFLLPQKMRTLLRVEENDYLDKSFVKKYSRNNTIAGNLYGSSSLNDSLIDHFEYKLEHLLKWDDRNSMASSIESRVPFLDYRLVEKTLATANTKKIHNGVTKSILREAMKGTLPEKIRIRMDKVGFDTPQDEWFRTPIFKEFIYSIISSDSFAKRGLFNVEKVRKLYSQHLNREINIAKDIWKWINIELWYREFIDNNKS